MQNRTIQRVAVVGSGTMGGGIAAHFANAGIPVYLLDLSPQIVKASFDRLKKSKPPAFFTSSTADLVTIGALDEHEAWLGEADWIVEAIVEQLEPKRELIGRIDRLRKPGSIVSTNTSGLPIAQLAANASADLKAHFLGTHFFNPPRHMKLLELIPTPDTDRGVVDFVRDFADRRLGKGVVIAKDTPNFIANRLASIGGATAVDFAVANGYTIEEVDAITGPLIGRPKTAVFRLQDLVGLDVAAAVANNLYDLIEGDESREILRSPHGGPVAMRQLERNRFGDKTGEGFYKKSGKNIQTLDLETLEYRDRIEPQIPSIAEGMKIASVPERLKFVLKQDDKAGALARHVVYNALAYAARRVPEISENVADVDRAVRWGFSYDLGPFELWDALGVRETAAEMEKYGVSVPDWVKKLDRFYSEANRYYTAPPAEAPLDERVLSVHVRSFDDIGRALDQLEKYEGMVLIIDDGVGQTFSSGQPLDGPDKNVWLTQQLYQRVRFSPKPIVAAIAGRVLNASAELAMASTRIVAAAETYIGLTEIMTGVIPALGGCKELIRRVVSPVMKRTPNADPVPLVQNVLQTIAMAKVSSSAEEARELGFLGEADRVVMNRDRVLAEAIAEVLELAENGYAPPAHEKNCFAAGRDAAAALKAGIYQMVQGAYVPEAGALISRKIAEVLCGGNLSSAQWVGEQYFLDREREAYEALTAEKS